MPRPVIIGPCACSSPFPCSPGCSCPPARAVPGTRCRRCSRSSRRAEARDADRFGERLTAGFEGAGATGRAETVAQLRRYLAAYESVAIEVYRVEVERQEGAARVRCVVEFSGQARKTFGLEGLLPPSAVYRFELDVADEGGTWRVRGATWEPAGDETQKDVTARPGSP
jgi:hypothetical protein